MLPAGLDGKSAPLDAAAFATYSVDCSECVEEIAVGPKPLGSVVRCPGCGARMRVVATYG